MSSEDLARRVGLDAQQRDEPPQLIPFATLEALLREIHALTGDATFGLRVARQLERGAFRGLEYAMRASATLGEGLERLARFGPLLHGCRLYELEPLDGGGARLRYASLEDHAAGLAADLALAAVVAIGRDATGAHWAPELVHLRHDPPANPRAFRRFFARPVQFGQIDNQLVLSGDCLGLRMAQADAGLAEVLDQYLEGELQSLDPVRSLEEAVRAAIGRALPEQDATLEGVAADIGLSPRVLQKRLQQGGTSFQEQLDRVRMSLAKRYLIQPEISLGGAALLLGYSDVTAFHRAFKRWTGMTPGEFRRQGLGRAG